MKHRVKIPRIFKNHYKTTNRMAKDPAFLFYDADAARDVSHMNRLERGCYFDILQAQKKFGRLSKDAISKVLGKDFESCWGSIQMILTVEGDTYFIEWLENSIEKRKAFTDSRKKNREGSRKKAHLSTENPSSVNHMSNTSGTSVDHMVNENENVLLGNKGIGNTGEVFTFSGTGPPVREVIEWFMRNGQTEAQAMKFYNYQEGLGWKKGITKISNWSAFANMWMANNQSAGGSAIVKYRGPTGEGTMSVEEWKQKHEGNSNSSLRRIA